MVLVGSGLLDYSSLCHLQPLLRITCVFNIYRPLPAGRACQLGSDSDHFRPFFRLLCHLLLNRRHLALGIFLKACKRLLERLVLLDELTV